MSAIKEAVKANEPVWAKWVLIVLGVLTFVNETGSAILQNDWLMASYPEYTKVLRVVTGLSAIIVPALKKQFGK